jgi:heptose I phosphotransferase
MPWHCNQLEMPPELSNALGGGDVFERVMALQGQVFRDVPGRRTIRVNLAGRSCFVKLHFGVGWREIFKNLFSLRLPIVSALTERQAIRRLTELGIPTTPAVAYGCRGISPASWRSFVITEDLGDIISLEDFCRDWAKNPPPLHLKRQLIAAVAHIARILHDNGLNHRDFYLCHFCLDAKLLAKGEVHLYLLDLHRMGMRPTISEGARLKDMAALYFSAMDCGLSTRDILRFLRLYRNRPLHELFPNETGFWQQVCRRADLLYVKYQERYAGIPKSKQHASSGG